MTMPEEKLIITVEDRNGISEIATMANMVVYGDGSRPISRYFIQILIFLITYSRYSYLIMQFT